MQLLKSCSLFSMSLIVFGSRFADSYSSTPSTAFPLRGASNVFGSSIYQRVPSFHDDMRHGDVVAQPAFDDELTSYLVKNGLYKAGCDRYCPGKCVAHPQTSEPICICERGKGIHYRHFPDFCADCDCGFGQISCSFNDFGPNQCYCDIGYENKNGTCVKIKRPCDNNPCENGGKCWEKLDRTNYMCTCPKSHTGKNCQQDSNSCDSNPCLNGGVCWIGKGSEYLCICPETHAGKHCQREVHICDSKPCLNGGSCWRGNDSDHHCSCPSTHTGENCQTAINPCASKPCKNGGKCWRGEDLNYLCTCKSDYNGRNCEERQSISSPTPTVRTGK